MFHFRFVLNTGLFLKNLAVEVVSESKFYTFAAIE